MDSAQLLALDRRAEERTVAVIGDVVADEFVYGRVARVSREAPVLILEYDSTEIVPGGGGNAANNVAALGGRAILAGVVGRDEPGRRLLAALHTRASIARSVVRAARHQHAGQDAHPRRRHSLGQAAGGAHRSRGERRRQSMTRARCFERRALAAAMKADAVLVSDYGVGPGHAGACVASCARR